MIPVTFLDGPAQGDHEAAAQYPDERLSIVERATGQRHYYLRTSEPDGPQHTYVFERSLKCEGCSANTAAARSRRKPSLSSKRKG